MRFGVFELNTADGELRKNGFKVGLARQFAEVLVLLVQRAGETVARQDLIDNLWPGDKSESVQLEHRLNNAVQKVREALDDSATCPLFLQTIPRLGYRFIAPVTFLAARHAGEMQTRSLEEDFLDLLKAMGQQLFSASTPQELRALLYRLDDLLDRHPNHSCAHEGRLLRDTVRAALDAEQSRTGGFPTIFEKALSTSADYISLRTAGEVFDDPYALSVHDGLGRWRTVGTVRGQPIVVGHTVEKRDGSEVIRIIAARKAKLSESRNYAKQKEQ